MIGQRAKVTWAQAGTPVSTHFDDRYFSHADGVAETGHVYLCGNDLPKRLSDGFRVAELGFGTGLNALALAAVVPDGQRLSFVTFEAFPMRGADAAKALVALALPVAAGPLVPVIANALDRRDRNFALGPVDVTLVLGDARDMLPDWQGQADAWFLDGFAPAQNPEMWEPALMDAVARHTGPGGTFATYTASGAVRRNLDQAGFDVTRAPGYGRKRHMTRGVLRGGP